MLQKSSLTLSDGTTLDDLIMRDSNEVSLRVMTDKELYDIEMERIFAKTWLLLGHESEIPNSGDFIVRDMAEDNVIIARDREGAVGKRRPSGCGTAPQPRGRCRPTHLDRHGLSYRAPVRGSRHPRPP